MWPVPRLTNRVYATHDRAWMAAIGRGGRRALAVDQTRGLRRTPDRTTGRRDIAYDRERHAPLDSTCRRWVRYTVGPN
jgi:hypothetical protein